MRGSGERTSCGRVSVFLLAVCVTMLCASSRLLTKAGQDGPPAAALTTGDIAFNRADGPGYHVEVTRASEQRTAAGAVLYDLSYDYQFVERDTVYIPSLGTVPGSGRFRYLTPTAQLEILESISGPVLVTVPVAKTIETMDSNTSDIPEAKYFPDTFKSGTWTPPATFPAAAAAVMDTYFQRHAMMPQGPLNVYVTPYQPLRTVDRNVRAEASIRITQPYDATTRRFTFRVEMAVRDRPRQSDIWKFNAQCSAGTLAAAEDLHRRVMGAFTEYERKRR